VVHEELTERLLIVALIATTPVRPPR